MSLTALIVEIEKGSIKVPQFQRDFLFEKSKEKTDEDQS